MWPRTLVAILAMIEVPWQCPARPAVVPAPTVPKVPAPPGARVVTGPPPAPPRHAIELPEAVTVHALDGVRSAFVRCFARARNLDPTLGRLKVSLHLDVDERGAVTAAIADEGTRAATPKLAGCLAIVARSMTFPAPGQPAVVDVPLLD